MSNLKRSFFRYVGQTSPSPLALEIERADGVFLYSKDRRYFDLVSGVSVSNVGHCNREVIDAVKKQLDNYSHLMVYGEIIQSPQVLHAELLASLLPEKLSSVYYVNSGSEANEAALKLAKRVTGRIELIGCLNAYHGSSHGVLSLIGSEEFKSSFRPLLPEIRQIRFNNFEDLEQITEKSACFIVEPIQGEAGIIPPAPGYLQAVRKRCDETGTLLIFDEIQTGFGRTGSLFAFQKYGVVPDILTLAKALGGGLPLGACVTSPELMSAWQTNPVLGHITTFGGHPLSCAAALASLKILLREEWISKAEEKGRIYEEALISHPAVKEIRRSGLMIAVDVYTPEKCTHALQTLLEEGVMSDLFLFQPTSFRIAPPLCITEEEIRESIEVIIKVLDRL